MNTAEEIINGTYSSSKKKKKQTTTVSSTSNKKNTADSIINGDYSFKWGSSNNTPKTNVFNNNNNNDTKSNNTDLLGNIKNKLKAFEEQQQSSNEFKTPSLLNNKTVADRILGITKQTESNISPLTGNNKITTKLATEDSVDRQKGIKTKEGYTTTGRVYGDYFYQGFKSNKNLPIVEKDGKYYVYNANATSEVLKYQDVDKMSFLTGDSEYSEAVKQGYKGKKDVRKVSNQIKLDTDDLTTDEKKQFTKDLLRQEKAEEKQQKHDNTVRYGGAGLLGSLGELKYLGGNVANTADKEVISPVKNFKRNYDVGEMNNKLALEYYKKMNGEENNVEEVEKEYQQFLKYNQDLVEKPGAAGTAIQNMETQVESIKKQGIAASILMGSGAAIGGAVGGKAGAVTGAKAGAYLGYTFGATPYTYQLEAGNQYKALLDMGVPDDIAKKYAKITGGVNAGIESGENIIDLFTLGIGSKAGGTVRKEVVNEMVDEYGESTVRSWLKKKIGEESADKLIKIGKTAGLSYVQNIGSEGLEEAAQEGTSIAGERLAANEAGIKRDTTLKEDFNRVGESFKAGAISTAFTAPLSSAGGAIVTNTINTIGTKVNNKTLENNVNKQIAEYEKSTGTKFTTEEKAELKKGVIATIQERIQSNPEQISNTTTQQVNSNLATDASSNTLNTTRSTAYKYFGDKNNNINETLDILDDIKAKRSNDNGTLNIEFDDTVGANGVHIAEGNNRTIKVNPNSKNYLEQIVVHELSHDLENSSTYKQLQKYITDIAVKDGSYQKAKDSLTKAYKDYYEKNNLDFSKVDMDIETTNDILGKAIGNQEFLNTLAKEQPSLFKRVFNYVKNVLFDGNKTGKTLKERQQLNNIQSMFREAMNEGYNNSNGNASKTSLSYTDNESLDGRGIPALENAKQISFRTKDDGSFYVQALDQGYGISYDGTFINKSSLERTFGEDIANYIAENSKIGENQEVNVQSDINDANSYFMTHRPSETGITADNIINQDVETPMPKDMYDHPEYYFNMREKYTKESIAALNKVRNNPEGEITIYRATPGDTINPGDWVTLSKSYAEMHNESQLDGKGNVLELKVKAKDVQFAGDEINEFGYFPTNSKQNTSMSLSPTRNNTSWNKYLNDNWDLMPEATKTNMKKELLSPLKEQVKEIKGIKKEISKEIKDLKETISEFKALTKEDLPALERQYNEDFRNISESDIPTTEGYIGYNEDVNVKNKNEIVKDIKEKFGIKQQEARDLYNKIANKALSNEDVTTVEDIYNELADYRDVVYSSEDKELKDIKSELRKTRINIDDFKDQITDYRYKDYFGKLRISKEGQPVDAVYQEFSDMYPAYFPKDITTQADQFNYLADFMNKDVNIDEKFSIDDSTLYSWAEEMQADIGNRERYRANQDSLYFANKYYKNMEAPIDPTEPSITKTEKASRIPDRKAFDEAVVRSAKEVEKKLGYAPKDPTKLESYDSIDDMVAAGDADISGFMKESNSKTPKIKESKKSTLKKTVDNFYSDFVNRNRQLDNLAKESGNNEIKYKADRLNNVMAEVQGDITTAQTDNYGNAIGKSLSQIFQPAKDSGLYDYFDDYLKHKSNIERHKQGKGSKVDATTSKHYVEAYESKYPQFTEWSDDVYKYNKNNLSNGLENGLISLDFYKHLTDIYKSYVPFYSESDMTPSVNMTPDEIRSSRPVKRASGGASSVLAIEKAMTSQTYSWKNAIAKNDLYKELVNTIDDRVDIGADARIDPTSTDDTLYQDENGKYLTAYINGERETVYIDNELFKELDRGLEKQIKEWEEKYSAITKPLQKASQIRGQILTSWSPSFIVKNPIKDIQDALLNTKNFGKYTKNLPSAITDSKKAGNLNKIAESFKKQTGLDINTVDEDTKLNNKAQKLYKDYQDAQTWNRFVTLYGSNSVSTEFMDSSINRESNAKNKNFLKKIPQANEFMEIMFRYPEFKATLENGGSVTEALYNAREITTNFGRGGTISKAINRNGATFFNTSVQGFDKFIRNFSGENGARGIVSSLAKATMLGVVPAVFNHLVFGGDDEEYEALPDYIKDNYYLIKTGNGNFIRIPKGRMISVFGSTARRTLEYAEGDKEAFEGQTKNVMDQIGFTNPLKENILSPLKQAYGSGENGEAWYGGDLVPTRLQSKPKAEQYDESTDEFSKFIGKTFNISPYKLNYVIDQYTGGVGDILLPMATKETTNDSKGLGMITAPIKDIFTANSTMDNKYAGEFYDLNEKLKIKANSSSATDEDKLKSKYMQSVSSDLGKLYGEKREIQNDSTLSKDEKYEKLKAIQDEINTKAKEAKNSYNNINKTSNYAIVGDKEYYLKGDTWQRVSEDKEDDFNALGMDIDEKSEYYTATSKISSIKDNESDSDTRKKLIIDEVLNTNLTEEQKSYLYGSYYSSDKTLSKLADSGVSFNNYLTYERDTIGSNTDEKESYLANSNFDKQSKTAIYENTVLTNYDDTTKNTDYRTAKAAGIDIDNWLDYSSHEFKADKNANGKSISGSRKKKVFDYINSSDMTFEQKVILAKLEYPSYNEYNYEIVNYLNNNDSVSYDDMVYILTNLGMTVDDNGNVRW